MVKVGVISYVTHSIHLNYGATLHGYAFQYILKKYFGTDSIVVDYVANTLKGYNLKYPVLNYNIKGRFFGLANWLNWLIGFRANINKYKKFQKFINEKLIITNKKYSWDTIRNDLDLLKYNIDIWVCESDVIWKLYEKYGFDYGFFLKFIAANDKKKIAYTPSMQARKFNKEEEKEFLSLVQSFDAISVRERQSAEYLSQLLNKKIDWLIDPTLLLQSSDYEDIIATPREQKYILLYNCMKNDFEMLKEAEKFAREKGLSLIEISNYSINKLLCHHKVITDAGIEEWLGYIKHAEYVICNAFHGFCLSVIFKKEVFLFQRDESDYRMKNIATELGCMDHFIPCSNKKIPNNLSFINYEEVYAKLEQYRQKAFDFIKNNIMN